MTAVTHLLGAPTFDPGGAFTTAPTPTPGPSPATPTPPPPPSEATTPVKPSTPPTFGPLTIRTPMPALMPDGSVNLAFEWLKTEATWECIYSATTAAAVAQAAAWRRVRGES